MKTKKLATIYGLDGFYIEVKNPNNESIMDKMNDDRRPNLLVVTKDNKKVIVPKDKILAVVLE